jgi:hypothetical protein
MHEVTDHKTQSHGIKHPTDDHELLRCGSFVHTSITKTDASADRDTFIARII